MTAKTIPAPAAPAASDEVYLELTAKGKLHTPKCDHNEGAFGTLKKAMLKGVPLSKLASKKDTPVRDGNKQNHTYARYAMRHGWVAVKPAS